MRSIKALFWCSPTSRAEIVKVEKFFSTVKCTSQGRAVVTHLRQAPGTEEPSKAYQVCGASRAARGLGNSHGAVAPWARRTSSFSPTGNRLAATGPIPTCAVPCTRRKAKMRTPRIRPSASKHRARRGDQTLLRHLGQSGDPRGNASLCSSQAKKVHFSWNVTHPVRRVGPLFFLPLCKSLRPTA